MKTDTTITKVGGSLYILIPSFIVDSFKLKNGDLATMEVEKDRVIFIVEMKKEK